MVRDGNAMIYLRHKAINRISHWTTALFVLLTLISGLSFMFPYFQMFSYIYGTPQLTRILHPFGALVMTFTLMILCINYWRYNKFAKGDLTWLFHIKDVLLKNDKDIPPAGKYNAGQKLILRQFLLCSILLLVSGIVIWNAYFSSFFEIEIIRVGILLHSVVAFIFCISLIIHAYMAYWVQGSIDGMLEGKVSGAWIKHHHPLWYKELISKYLK